MKKKILFCIFCLIISFTGFARDTSKINLSLWYPLSVPCKKELTTHFSFGLPQSRVYNLYGVGLNVVGAEVSHNVSGVSIGGIYSYIKNDARGVTVAGLANIVQGQSKGLQYASLLNMTVGEYKGVQFSGVSNMGIRDIRGVQMSGIYNVASSTLSGLQLSAVGNIASKGSNAIQLSGGFNISIESMKGIQLAIGNFADTIKGIQIGLLNVSDKVNRGLQLGLVNYHNDTTGLHLGLINITRQSKVQMMVYLSNYSIMNVAARVKNKHSYSIVGLGLPYDAKKDFSGTVFYRLGYTVPVKRFDISADFGVVHVAVYDNDYSDEAYTQYSLQGRINLEYKPNNRLGVFISGGYAFTSEYGYGSFDRKPLIEAGIAIF